MNVGFLSTRLAGTDGVSLETAKFAAICRRLGHEVFYCAGELDADGPPARLVPAMHFSHPEAVWIHDHSFGHRQAPADLRPRIAAMAASLKGEIASFVSAFQLDVLVAQNAVAIPMHIPLGVAIADFVHETGFPLLAHNHDYYWERDRFTVNAIPDLLDYAFPPAHPAVQHLAINSLAAEALRQRRGLDSTVLPNIFDYERAAPALSAFNADLRAAIGLGDDQFFILQPTRVVARKGIELALELCARLNEPTHRARLLNRESVLVITHHAGDEGLAYLGQLQDQAAAAGVHLIYAADRFAPVASLAAGRKTYSLWDAYVHADFVTYPSYVEGFGNALLETLYFRLPALVNRYPVYVADIAPHGFDLIEIDGTISETAVEQTVQTLIDPVRRRRMVEGNYHIARQLYSYEAVTPIIEEALRKCLR